MLNKIRTKFLRELFPYLKLKDNNLNIFQKIGIYINIVIQVFLIIWVCIYFFSHLLYDIQYNNDNVTIFSNDKYYDKAGYDAILETITQHINNTYKKDTNIEIYIVNNEFLYTLHNPLEFLPNSTTYAVTQGSKIFVKNANIDKNLIYGYKNDTRPENLDAVLVHEIVHILQSNKYGWFASIIKTPYWVKEGYPIYSASALSVYFKEDFMQYAKKQNFREFSVFEQDLFYGFMVKHAIEKLHKSVDDLHLGKVNYDEVLQSFLQEYNITKEGK